jgi:leukotriene-A4 hydrolase
MSRPDPHSYADTDHPQTETLTWRAQVDFATRILTCEVTLHLRGDGPVLDLDTRDLDVREVTTEAGAPLPFTLHPADPILGARLTVELTPGISAVRVAYRTSPDASALQWLGPEGTAGKREPFLFSQCQAIHARSIIPCQDTPRRRIRYRAALTVPRRLRSLMAAGFVGRREEGDLAVDSWEMPQPIPPYLLGIAVGDLVSRDLDARSRLWAEPSVMDACAWELESTPSLVAAGEALFGPYPWDRFDVLVMPPSFPYGGMENPRLTFVTPTLICGDRSQVSVIAHELAHSWTGNLVTNSSAEHFWLNEGWTRYAELRLVEATEGVSVAALHEAIARRALDEALRHQFEAGHPELTKLRLHLTGVDPEDASSVIPYDKGYLLLRAIEDQVGRPRFDSFLRSWIEGHAFQTVTTEDFVAFTEAQLPGVLAAVRADDYLHAPGLPDHVPVIRDAILDEIAAQGTTPPAGDSWSPLAWELWLETLPRPVPRALLDALHPRLDGARNYELLVAWLSLAAEAGYEPALPRIEHTLKSVGRMKYLRALYHALAAKDATRTFARRVFTEAAPGYHPIARMVMDRVIASHGG